MLIATIFRILVEVGKVLAIAKQILKLALDIRATQLVQGEQISKILAAVEPLPAVRLVINIDLEGQTIEGATLIEMTNSQQATATIQPVDAKGNPADIDTSNGGPVWASSDETIVTVTPSTDGLSAVVKAVGPLGTAKVSVTGDADLGPDTKAIFGELDVTITKGLAVGFKIELGPASEQ